MTYDSWKTTHLLALILWAGPALGAYWTLALAWRGGDGRAIVAAEKACEQVLRLEHVAFVALVGSGIAMLAATDWALVQTAWMRQKLHLFGLVVAFELFDMWLSHRVLPVALSTEAGITSEAGKRAQYLRLWLARLAVPIGAVIVLMTWLAVSKEGLGGG